MSKGYLISKNNQNTEFFTSSSAYDRPVWKPVAEATVYASPELADAAAKKLYKNGSYSARLVSLEEISLQFEPIDTDLPTDDELPPTEDGLEGDDEDEMVASDQNDDLEIELIRDPNSRDDEDDIDDDLDGEGDDIDDDLDGEGEEDDLHGELDGEDAHAAGRSMGMVQLAPAGSIRRVGAMESATMPARPTSDAKPTPTNTPHQNVEVIKYKDASSTGVDKADVAGEQEKKVTAPASAMSALKTKISEFKREADNFKTSDDARASFAMTAADALETIHNYLASGTVSDIKKAAVFMTSLMNPISTHIPADIVKFISYQGEKPSLKDMFNTKKDQRK